MIEQGFQFLHDLRALEVKVLRLARIDHDGTLQNGEPLRPGIIAPNGGIPALVKAGYEVRVRAACPAGVLLWLPEGAGRVAVNGAARPWRLVRD